VQHLPNVGYSVQQMLIDALTKAAATQPPQFADQLLPLVASGDAATRTAVMKILLGMPSSSEMVKRYVAVNDVESLTADFSRKVWQKITILDVAGFSTGSDG